MITKKIMKQLLLISMMISASPVLAIVDSSLWDDVVSAFEQIAVMDAHFVSSKAAFSELKNDYSNLYLQFDVYKQKRIDAFACIQTSIESLTAQLNAAIENKALIEYNAAQEQALLRAQIEATRIERQVIMDGLEAEKVSLQSEIDQLKIDLAFLESLSTERVAESLIDIDAAIKSYQAMVVERTAFMDVLDTVLARAAAFEASQTNAIADMTDVCNS